MFVQAVPLRCVLVVLGGALLACGGGGGGGGAPDASVPPVADASGPDAEVLASCAYPGMALPPSPVRTPRWAFEPWISKDISDDADARAFVDGFKTRQIPVGAMVIDSPWETQYNTFQVNPTRYPGFDQLVVDMHAQDVRVVMWITHAINTLSLDLEQGGDRYQGPSPNHAEALEQGYFVNGGASFGWWKGQGSAIDFCSAQAMDWWHAQQDGVLALGIDGWKVDFAEEFMTHAPIETAAGRVAFQDYSEAMYRDFLAYGVMKNGPEFVTMVRPYDRSYFFDGRFFARKEHAPVGWVGDNHRNFDGLSDALDHMFRSALAGYVVIGSDIGGYLDADERNQTIKIPFDQEVFARWTAVGALSPFMQLHGRANIAPWTVPVKVDETVALYRYWAWMHHQLVPFFYSLAAEASAGGPVIVHPVDTDEASWPGDFRYHLGEALLVAPILDASGKRDVELPAGAAYYDWWNPGADAIAGGTTVTGIDLSGDQRKIPLYVRAGAILPAQVGENETELGDASSAGHLTVAVWPAATPSSFVLHELDDTTTMIGAGRIGASAIISLSRAVAPTILRVRTDAGTAQVTLGGQALPAHADRAAFDAASSGWFHDPSVRATWVKLPAAAGTQNIVLTDS
jgi:alpha-glucosidase (family GH31 glycosyl hydrolase)